MTNYTSWLAVLLYNIGEMMNDIPNNLTFSLMVPTRHRIDCISKLIESLDSTIRNGSLVELLIVYDNDDNETDAFLSSLPKYKFSIRTFKVERSLNFSRDYYNFLTKQACGKFFWALNDDVIFKTEGWDVLLANMAEQFLKNKKDRICYIGVYDNTDKSYHRANGYTCFPILSREYVNVIGTFFFECTRTWGADGTLWDLFLQIPDRVLNVTESIALDHVSIHNFYNHSETTEEGRRSKQDAVSSYIQDDFIQNPPSNKEIKRDVKRALKLIRRAIIISDKPEPLSNVSQAVKLRALKRNRLAAMDRARRKRIEKRLRKPR